MIIKKSHENFKDNINCFKYRYLGIIGKILIFIPSLILMTSAAAAADAVQPGAVLGDVTGDGIVSAADVNYILNYSASLSADYSDTFAMRADLNRDGVINAADARIAESQIKQHIIIEESEEISETQTAPLVDGSSIITSAADGSGETPVINQNGGTFTAVSNQKMYIYPDLSQVMELKNCFTIISFGWGHGVGMSQLGAIGLARAGYSYIQIVQHYYRNVIIMKENYPATVKCAGRDVDTVEMLARIIQMEIAGCTKSGDPIDMNALRAQAVAAYTNMKFSGYKVSGCSYVNSYANCRDDVKQVAKEIAGQYIKYNGEVVYAYYSACSAGVSAPYETIWGETGRDMSYLYSAASYSDCYTSDYISATIFSTESIKNYIKSYDSSIVLSDDPSEWISILEHDDAVNENIGYVSKMRIGDRVLSSGAGLRFRDYVMDYDIKSPCFAIIYNGKYL